MSPLPSASCSALLLVDQGPGAGLGHRRRMEALGVALHVAGWTCRISSIEAPSPELTMAAAAASAATGRRSERAPDVVVIDSYRCRADEPAFTQCGARAVVAIDDLRRDLEVDLLVDPSPGASAEPHRRARRVLAGAEYALVRAPEPAIGPVPPGAQVSRVLVTTGAADAAGAGARLATAVHERLPAVDVRLVVGPWGAPATPNGVTVLDAPASLADEMGAAGVVVTAGGIAMLEACLLGRPVVAVVLAENQRLASSALAASGAVELVDAVAADDLARAARQVAAAVAGLADDAARRRELAGRAHSVLDGRGPERVASAIADVVAATAPPPVLRGGVRRP